jgi:Carbohydrate binding module (family 35)
MNGLKPPSDFGRVRTALFWGVGVALLLIVGGGSFYVLARLNNHRLTQVPYDHTNPVIYDNDSVEDIYTDELIMALQTEGRIDLRGMITTEAGWSESWITSEAIAQNEIEGRRELVAKARRSGMTQVPTPVAGSVTVMREPLSGRIEDTVPQGTDGAQLIVREARLASARKPLVILVGGPAATVADAYLLDPGITNHVIIAWCDWDDFNGEAPPFIWATEIVLRNFTCVLFGKEVSHSTPVVEKASLVQLPNTELRQYMIDKSLPHVHLPGGRDGDASVAIPLITSNYVRTVYRCRWAGHNADGMPTIEQSDSGRLWRVTGASQATATAAWWRTMTNAASWGAAPAPVSRPFGGRPFPVPGRIVAAQFDEGGPGVAYFDTDKKNLSQSKVRDITPYRVLEHVDFEATSDSGGGYNVTQTAAHEWLNYTIKVTNRGAYRLSARIASSLPGGLFYVSFDETNRVSPVTVPSTAGGQSWQSLPLGQVTLSNGTHCMRVHIEQGGFNLNWIELAEAGSPPTERDGVYER